MRQKNVFVLMILATILIAAAPAALAQDEAPDKKFGRRECSSEGIWYGGNNDESDGYWKHIIHITPNGPGRYLVTAESGYAWPYPAVTNLHGESLKISKNRYEGFLIGLQEYTGGFPPATPPFIIAVHSESEFIDCDTMVVHYDFQGLYAWGQEPFVDPPLQEFGTGYETYKRMATPEWPPAGQAP